MRLNALGLRPRLHENVCFGRAVRHLRRRRGVSRWCLARDFQLPYRAIVALELGMLDPTLMLLMRVSAGLRIAPALLGHEMLNEDYLVEIGGERQLRTRANQAPVRQSERLR